MKQRREYAGSITVLASLSLMLIASLFLSLLEAARFNEMKKVASVCTSTAVESLFANYQPTIWEEYNLLLLEAGESEIGSFKRREAYLKEMIDEELVASGKNTGSYFQGVAQRILLNHYHFVTDQQGEMFEVLVAASMGNQMSADLYEEIESIGKEMAIYEADASNVEQKMSQVREYNYEENVAKDIEEVGADGILALVLPKGTMISGKEMANNQILETREMAKGSGDIQNHQIYHSLMTEGYLLTNFSNYQEAIDSRGLRYELEYVIAGKASEEENLKAVVHRMLLVREAANFAYLMTDSVKMAEAEAIAVTIATLAVNPFLVEPIKYGLLATWAYVESILDVRALLDGKKVDLFKNSASWTSDIKNLPAELDGFVEAKESETGVGYQMYLAGFLFCTGIKARSYRALTAMEETVRSQEKRSFYINDLICDADLEVTYRYPSAFGKGEYFTESIGRYSYLCK